MGSYSLSVWGTISLSGFLCCCHRGVLISAWEPCVQSLCQYLIMVISNRLSGSGIHSSAFTSFTSPILWACKGCVWQREAEACGSTAAPFFLFIGFYESFCSDTDIMAHDTVKLGREELHSRSKVLFVSNPWTAALCYQCFKAFKNYRLVAEQQVLFPLKTGLKQNPACLTKFYPCSIAQ